MKKVLVSLLMVIPLIIVATVMFVTKVMLLEPIISVDGVRIVDENGFDLSEYVVDNFYDGILVESLFASVSPKGARDRTVLWEIDYENAELYDKSLTSWKPGMEESGNVVKIAEVDENGIITVHCTGSFDVWCVSRDGGYRCRCTIVVPSEVATKAFIVLNGEEAPDSLTVKTDEIARLDACARPTDVDIDSVSWESSDPDVLRVDGNGIVTPVRPGTATVTLTVLSLDGNPDNDVLPRPLTDRLTVTVERGFFKVPFYSLYTGNLTEYSVPLEDVSYDPGNTALDGERSGGAEIRDGRIVFADRNGTAVLVNGNGPESLTVRADSSRYAIENAVLLSGTTVIVGKIPVALRILDNETGRYLDNAEFKTSVPGVLEIDGGVIRGVSEGSDAGIPVAVTAGMPSGETVGMEFFVRKPVKDFRVETLPAGGIARERIYGNRRYTDDAGTSASLTWKKLRIGVPASADNSRFEWEAESDVEVSISGTGELTFGDFDDDLTHAVTVRVTALDSAYAADRVSKKYVFDVRRGINVETADQLRAANAAEKRELDIFMQRDITFISYDHGWQLYCYNNLYGNGHMLNWRHTSFDPDHPEKTIAESLKGARIICLEEDGIFMRNVRVQGAPLPLDGTVTSRSFGEMIVCPSGSGQVLRYCQIENGDHAVYNGCPDLLVDGCVLNNTTKFSLMCWCGNDERPYHITLRNTVFGPCVIPSIGMSADDNSRGARLDLEGFVRIYNWKNSVDTDLFGDIFGSDVPNHDMVNALLKQLINTEINKKIYDPHCYFDKKGERFMHGGILVSGLNHAPRCSIYDNGVPVLLWNGDTGEDVSDWKDPSAEGWKDDTTAPAGNGKNGLHVLRFDVKNLGEDDSGVNVPEILEASGMTLHPEYVLGYTDENPPLLPGAGYVMDEEFCAALRGERELA